MKTLGIVGGLGPESTIDYYRSIVELYRKRVGGVGYPPIVITSLDVDKAIEIINAGQMLRLANYFASGVKQLAEAGADYAVIAANTAHIVFNEVRKLSRIPLISIVEATCEEVKRRGMTRVGLLGTGFTMGGRFYQDVFEKQGIAVVVPSDEERARIHQKYLDELLRGTFLPETRTFFQDMIGTLKERDGIEGVVLAGTELPLLLRDESISGLPLLDTTQIHVKAALEFLLG
jgi:aspartate racemase